MKKSVWSLTCQQRVFKRYHSGKHFPEFYPQDGGANQLAQIWIEISHCHPMYMHIGHVIRLGLPDPPPAPGRKSRRETKSPAFDFSQLTRVNKHFTAGFNSDWWASKIQRMSWHHKMTATIRLQKNDVDCVITEHSGLFLLWWYWLDSPRFCRLQR